MNPFYRRLPAGRRLVLHAFVLASLVVAGCGGSSKPTSLPVKDDFSDCSTGWSTDTDKFVALGCTDGAYRVSIKNPLLPQNARIFFGKGATSLNIEADAARRAGPRKVGGNEFLAFGVGCWASLVHGYLFIISPDGFWGIEKITSGSSVPMPLAESVTTDALPGLMATNRIRGVCVGGGPKATTLALYVNGERIASAEDPDGFGSFPGFGFFVFSSASGADVRFDNLVARELTAAEARRARPSETKQTPNLSGSNLCETDGIHYAGATAQGAGVCLTLSANGRNLIETVFSFVQASGCPDRAAGTVRSDYPGALDPSGRIVNPDGLTATIQGDTASGVFSDSDICPGKKFKWSAQRVP